MLHIHLLYHSCRVQLYIITIFVNQSYGKLKAHNIYHMPFGNQASSYTGCPRKKYLSEISGLQIHMTILGHFGP